MINSVAICGSRSIVEGNLAFRRLIWAIEKVIQLNPEVVFNIGDANGVDIEAQKILCQMNHDRVIVWHVKGNLRNLANDEWETRAVDYNSYSTRYTERDSAMIENAEKLIAVWDGKSKGTLRNIQSFSGELELIREGINISSKSRGIGAALSLRDDLANQRKLIKKSYPVTAHYELLEENCVKAQKDFTSVYDLLRSMEVINNTVDVLDECRYGKVYASNIIWLTYCLKAKFLSNEYLFNAVRERGGYDWLNTCSYTVVDGDFKEIEDNIGKYEELGENASFTDDEEMHNDIAFSDVMADCMNYKYLTGTGSLGSLFIHCLAEAYNQASYCYNS